MGRRHKQRNAASASEPVAIPQAPVGFFQGLLAPLKLMRALMARPFAWLRPSLAAFMVFVALITLFSELIAHALFPGGEAHQLMRGRQFANSFLPWLFSPSIIVVFMAGAIRFLGRGRLEYGLVKEPLLSRTGALLGLGLMAMFLAMGVIGAGRFWGPWGSTAAGVFLLIFWNPIMTMTSVQIWAQDSALLSSLRWALRAVWQQKTAWMGITACYLLSCFIAVLTGVGIVMGLTALAPGPGALALIGLVGVMVVAWLATVANGMNALLALALHHQITSAQTARG